MLTLSEINALTNSHDGDIYSDLFKDVYGSRPRGQMFESLEAFDSDFRYLSKRLDEQLTEENVHKARNLEDFVCRVEGIMQMVPGADRVRAIAIIADAEDKTEEVKFYGHESLEYHFNLKYGSINRWLGDA